MLQKISVLFLISISIIVNLINCDTILFTNSPNHLVKNSNKNFTSYKLEVPGSNTITIIEANTKRPPIHHNNNNDNLQENRSPLPQMLDIENDEDKKTVFAPSLLEKFMNEYNIKVSSKLAPSDAIARSPIKRYDTHYADQDDSYVQESQHQQYYQQRPSAADGRNPFNQKEGWVTLQAVPWSKSQVARWKPKSDVRPINTVSGLNVYRDSPDDSIVYQKDTKYPGEQMMEEAHKANQYPNSRPNFYGNEKEYESSNHATATRRRPTSPMPPDSWENGKPVRRKPIFETNDKPQIEVAEDRYYDYGFRPDLEDKRQPPATMYNQQAPASGYAHLDDPDGDSVVADEYQNSMRRSPNRRPQPYGSMPAESQYSNQILNNLHTQTHPDSGNGEWVLVSTTKGYQHPKPTHSVPRRMNFDQMATPNETMMQAPTNYRTHKSIKLTVLPAKSKNGKLKPMALSHGGLIEVESSSNTVEDSAASEIKKKVKRKATTFSSLGDNNSVKLLHIPVQHQNNDKGAVLAAVSAGMVPATMAMLMPMMLGRKKRSIPTRIDSNQILNRFLRNFNQQTIKI